MRIESVLIILSICCMALYVYKQKEVRIFRLRQLIKLKRGRRYIKIRKELNSRLISKLKFMMAVIMNKELEFYSNRLWLLITVFAALNVIALILILGGGVNIAQRSLIAALAYIFAFRLTFEFCLLKHKREAHRYITLLQNETLKNNDIISCAADVSAKSLPSLAVSEIMVYINELVKNSAKSLQERYLKYSGSTFGYELPLIFVFLSNSSVSGNGDVIKRNLRALERYFSKSYERCKDNLFSKLPYMAIMLLIPLFMYWMDSFGAAMAVEGVPKSEPKEYIYIISLMLSYLYTFI